MDETVLKVAMRCYYPEEFVQLVVGHGFRVLKRWGGYAGELYGWEGIGVGRTVYPGWLTKPFYPTAATHRLRVNA